MPQEKMLHGPWGAGATYEKFDLFGYGGQDYIVTGRHVPELKHEPRPMASNSYSSYCG